MLRTVFSRFARDERGVTLVEYGVGVTLAVVVGITLLTALGSGINGNLIDAGTRWMPRAAPPLPASSPAADVPTGGGGTGALPGSPSPVPLPPA
jgi:pilus assembly protein Flp/PilA